MVSHTRGLRTFPSYILQIYGFRLSDFPRTGGDDEIRTHDPLLAGQVLSQLSYTPGSFFFSFVLSRMWKRRPSPSFRRSSVHRLFFVSEEKTICPLFRVGIELSSRAVSRKVFSPLQSLTSVFGMGTGGPSAFVTPTLQELPSLNIEQHMSEKDLSSVVSVPTHKRLSSLCTVSIERR